jgi:hypothetical protein
MNKHENNNDPLSAFINHEMIEKAPEGFTSKVMTMIQLEPKNIQNSHLKRERSIVPWVFAGVIIMLVISSFLLPKNNDLFSLPVLGILKRLDITLPSFDISKLDLITLPGWVPYIIAGILILSVFDRALYGLFHRREK